MATNHKISVDCVRSIKRKINVHIENSTDLQYEETNIKKIYGHPNRGTIRTDALVTTVITIIILTVIALAVMLSLNG